VSVKHALPAEIRIYDRLFSVENPSEEKEEDFRKLLNPDSLKIVKGFVEPSLANAKALEHYQFQRIGYFNVDPDSKPGQLVFNRTVSLKDSWAKIAKKE
jgi:glutaminyl-tRNA synthetase